MKPLLTTLLATTLLAAAVPVAGAQTMPGEGHTIVMRHDFSWRQGPPMLPPGAQAMILYGDPATEGPFTMRLRMPAGYSIPPHTHPKLESVTVLEGTLSLGMGEKLRPERTVALDEGSYFAMPPGTPHYAYTEQGTTIQLHGEGPWEIVYLNPFDDPRGQALLR